MARKQTGVNLIVIVILAFLGLNFVYPKYLNQGIDYLQLNLPHFPEVSFKLGLDLQGGISLSYQADLSNVKKGDRAEKMEVLRDVIEGRVNWYGVTEPIVQVQGGNKLIVVLAGIKDINEAIEIIGETPYLEFKEPFSEEERQEAMNNIPEEEILKVIESYKQKSGKEISREEVLEFLTIRLFKSTGLTGEYLKEARISFDQTTNKPQIDLLFKEEGSKLFEEITARNIGKPLAIFLDEKSIIDTDGDGIITDNDFYAPIVQAKITGGKAVITGEMNVNKAKEIVKRLNWGTLPIKIGSPISQKTVGPILGKISLEKSLKAGMIGFLMVILFMIGFYRGPGILASLALMIYAGIVLSLFKLIPVTLTLAGIGGVILSVGMAVDANVLIFERMKEERKAGKSFQRMIEVGFSRAWPSIRDSNLTTLIVALIMFFFGTSFIKGFALCLSLGILVSMFSAIFITRTFLRSFIGTRWEKVKFLWN